MHYLEVSCPIARKAFISSKVTDANGHRTRGYRLRGWNSKRTGTTTVNRVALWLAAHLKWMNRKSYPGKKV